MVAQVRQIFLLLLLLGGAVSVQAAELQAVPDRVRIGVEESLTLELRATGSVDGDPDLSVLEEDFELLGRSESSQIQITDGEIRRTTSWRIALLARSAGSKLIPPLCISSDCSEPVAIEVLPAGQGQSAASGGRELLLEVSAEPGKLRVQSQLIYKVRLLTRLRFLQASLSDPQPTGVEAVVQKLGEDRQYETRRDGQRYQVIERRYAIFPQQSGRLTIPPLRFDAQVSDGRSGNYPFNQRARQFRKRSEELSLEVLPAAEANGRPWLPARELQLEDDWQNRPPQLTVGEPVTRTLTLRATGLPAAQLPQFQLEIPEGFKSYPDQPSRQDRFSDSGVTGRLQQKLALVPTRPGRFRLPAVSVAWWDLNTERWRQAQLAEVEIEVLPQPGAPAAAAPPAVQSPAETPVETAPVPPAAAPAVDAAGFWPWLSLVLGLGWLLTLLLLLRIQRIRRRAENAPHREPQTGPGLKTARRELFRTLQGGEPAQVRTALLAWGEALYPAARPANLEQLAALCGEPLARQLETFSRSLYSRSAGGWDGKALQSAVAQAERHCAAKTGNGLPPLYPG